jgi:hypothetical protein
MTIAELAAVLACAHCGYVRSCEQVGKEYQMSRIIYEKAGCLSALIAMV